MNSRETLLDVWYLFKLCVFCKKGEEQEEM